MKRLGQILKWTGIALGAALAALLAVSLGWQTLAAPAERTAYPAPGRLVDIGGVKLHLWCMGEKEAGEPTVVLEGGSMEWSIYWQRIQPELAKRTRVCSYDRAGLGWSDPSPEPRTAKQLVKELRELLKTAGETGPFVIAAHSLWGPAALEYQAEYPEEVSGLVLIETWDTNLFSPMPEPMKQTLPLIQTLEVFSRLGLMRSLSALGALPLDEMLNADLLPEEYRAMLHAAALRPEFWRVFYQEYAAMETTAQESPFLAEGALGDLPLVVMRAGIRPADDYPPDPVWDAALDEQMKLSTRGELVVVADSGHYIQLERPERVTQAIHSVIDASLAAQ